MNAINQNSWNDRDEQFEGNGGNTATISGDRSGYSSGKYETSIDEDDQNLEDDDLKGRDLDTDNADEWDEDDVSETDLDEDDLRDDDEAIDDLHGVKNDQFGSLASSMGSITALSPDPDELPEERELDDDDELEYPDDDQMEHAEEDEVDYKESTEVERPEDTEAPAKATTLNNLDSTFTNDKHDRTTGRMGDHEPGSGFTPPEHGAYNL